MSNRSTGPGRSVGGGQMQQQLYRTSVQQQKDPRVNYQQQKSQSVISMADGE